MLLNILSHCRAHLGGVITGVSWNPKNNGEFAYGDSKGNMGAVTIINLVSRCTKSVNIYAIKQTNQLLITLATAVSDPQFTKKVSKVL